MGQISQARVRREVPDLSDRRGTMTFEQNGRPSLAHRGAHLDEGVVSKEPLGNDRGTKHRSCAGAIPLDGPPARRPRYRFRRHAGPSTQDSSPSYVSSVPRRPGPMCVPHPRP